MQLIPAPIISPQSHDLQSTWATLIAAAARNVEGLSISKREVNNIEGTKDGSRGFENSKNALHGTLGYQGQITHWVLSRGN